MHPSQSKLYKQHSQTTNAVASPKRPTAATADDRSVTANSSVEDLTSTTTSTPTSSRASLTVSPAPRSATTTTTTASATLPDQSQELECFKDFDQMPLHAQLLRGVYSFGFERPSVIQQQAIVPLSQGPDIIAQAPSGRGKTGAFAIGLLQRLDWRAAGLRQCQAFILSPTRELAEQNHDVISKIGCYLANGAQFCQLFVGGQKVGDDIKRITRATRAPAKGAAPSDTSPTEGIMVVVGTPGRVAQLIRIGALRVDAMKALVLDEADELLSQGFSDQLLEIMRYLPRDIQIGLFSATMPDEVLSLADRFMRDPVRILVPVEKLTLSGIRQFYVALAEEHKMMALKDLYESISISQSVIFVSSRRKAEWVQAELQRDHHTVACLHGDLSPSDRMQVMKQFRHGSSRVLVATDVISRGIDVQHVNIVINYDLPPNLEAYLHRIGRSGRYGRKGLAINFVSPREAPVLAQICQHYKIDVDELPEDFQTYLSE